MRLFRPCQLVHVAYRTREREDYRRSEIVDPFFRLMHFGNLPSLNSVRNVSHIEK